MKMKVKNICSRYIEKEPGGIKTKQIVLVAELVLYLVVHVRYRVPLSVQFNTVHPVQITEKAY